MDLQAVGRAMRRQFPVVFVIAVVTVYVAMSAAKDTQTRYEGRSSLLFVSSPSAYDNVGRPIAVNPLNLSGNGERVASSVVLAMSKSPAFEEQLRARGASGDVKIRRTADAILDMKATADTPAAALETLNTALTLVSDQLAASQATAGAPLGTYMKIETLTSTQEAREIEGSPMKSVGAIAVVGIVVAVAAALALDAVAPHGIRSGVRWVTRKLRGLGGALTFPSPRTGASAPRPSGSPPPATPPSPSPSAAPSAAPSAPAPSLASSAPAAPTPSAPAAPASSAPARGSTTPPPAATPAPTAPTSAATAGANSPNGGNRQMRRQAARTANRTRGREPITRTPRDADSAPRTPRSV